MIADEISSLVISNSWISAPVKVLEKIFKLPKLRIREVELFKALVRWCRAKAPNESAVRAEVDACVKLVRFKSMTKYEFTINCIACTSLLTRQEKFEMILRSNYNFTKVYVPKGFAPEIYPRNLNDQVEMFSWSDNDSTLGSIGDCYDTTMMRFQVGL